MKLGQKGRDAITGFEGVIVGKVEYLTGCNQVLLVAPAKEGKGGESHWFDDSRIEVTDRSVITLPAPERVAQAPGPDARRR